jgi:hypothetical protein
VEDQVVGFGVAGILAGAGSGLSGKSIAWIPTVIPVNAAVSQLKYAGGGTRLPFDLFHCFTV